MCIVEWAQRCHIYTSPKNTFFSFIAYGPLSLLLLFSSCRFLCLKSVVFFFVCLSCIYVYLLLLLFFVVVVLSFCSRSRRIVATSPGFYSWRTIKFLLFRLCVVDFHIFFIKYTYIKMNFFSSTGYPFVCVSSSAFRSSSLYSLSLSNKFLSRNAMLSTLPFFLFPLTSLTTIQWNIFYNKVTFFFVFKNGQDICYEWIGLYCNVIWEFQILNAFYFIRLLIWARSRKSTRRIHQIY